MTWKATAVGAGGVPAARVGRAGAEVVIRHTGSGDAVVDVRLPWPVWHGLVRATRTGRFDRLGAGWSAWTSSGGRSRLDGQSVIHSFGYLHRWEIRLPVAVWEALAGEMRAGRLDQLPAVDAGELAAEVRT